MHPAVSMHLRVLRDNGFANVRAVGILGDPELLLHHGPDRAGHQFTFGEQLQDPAPNWIP